MARDDDIDREIDHATDLSIDRAPRSDREREIASILAHGRRVRRPLPRGVWIASGLIGAICVAGFAVAMLDDSGSSHAQIERRAAPHASDRGAGFVAGLAIGGVAGLATGVALTRQRRDHSSRSSP